MLGWVSSWLKDRTQQVRVGSTLSNPADVKSGVPQGSVLGPVLFNIYIDDIDDHARDITLINKFADDTKGLQEIRCQADGDKLQATLDSLCDWAEKWSMQYNIKKCKIMHVGPGNPQRKYVMAGEELKTVEEERDIGVLIHKSLKPSRHCESAASTAARVLAQIKRNFHYRDKNTFKKLYCQYVRPHLEFSVPAWSPWLEGDIKRLEQVQISAVNCITGVRGNTYLEKLQELGMDTLQQRREKLDLMQAFKIIKQIDKVNPAELFRHVDGTGRPRTRLTADKNNLIAPPARLDVRKHFFTARVPAKWNNLDKDIKNHKTTASFKNALRSLDAGARP